MIPTSHFQFQRIQNQFSTSKQKTTTHPTSSPSMRNTTLTFRHCFQQRMSHSSPPDSANNFHTQPSPCILFSNSRCPTGSLFTTHEQHYFSHLPSECLKSSFKNSIPHNFSFQISHQFTQPNVTSQVLPCPQLHNHVFKMFTIHNFTALPARFNLPDKR